MEASKKAVGRMWFYIVGTAPELEPETPYVYNYRIDNGWGSGRLCESEIYGKNFKAVSGGMLDPDGNVVIRLRKKQL